MKMLGKTLYGLTSRLTMMYLLLMSTLLLLSGAALKAQSTATAYVSANITHPVGVSSTSSDGYTDVAVKTRNNRLKDQSKYEISVADFKLDADAQEVYSITVPGEMALRNKQGSSCITAFVNPLVAGQILPNGQKQFCVDSEIILEKGHMPGKHSSTPFEVTVNFN
jgi:hypothetical protein